MGRDRNVASGGKTGAIVGPGPNHKGFHDRRPDSSAGFILAIVTQDGKTVTIMRAGELVAVLKPPLRTHRLHELTMAECVLCVGF